jgi:hypothetical protein
MQLPVLENDFSPRVNAVVQKARQRHRGLYYQHVYVVKEDGEPALRFWALSCLIQDRADSLPGYQQFIQQLREKVCRVDQFAFMDLTRLPSAGQCLRKRDVETSVPLYVYPTLVGTTAMSD